MFKFVIAYMKVEPTGALSSRNSTMVLSPSLREFLVFYSTREA